MNIDQIIGKLMGDGSVGEERSALDAWKKEAEENAKALEEIQKIAAFSSTMTGYKDFNVDSAWDSFSDTLIDNNGPDQKSLNTETDTNTKKASIFSIKNFSRVAAVAVLAIGSLFLINMFLNPKSVELAPDSYSSTMTLMNFDLADGTQVTLDKNSDLNVLKDREVSLKGRAHFDVQRDESKQFTIDMPVGKVIVLGTEFTIDADDNTTEVFVEEGSVRYELGDRTWTLVAGDLVKVSNNEGVKLRVRDENQDSWKDQRLVFRDNNMVEVVDALSRHFKKDIVIENKKDFTNCNVMDVFTNSTLIDILNGLSKTHGLKFQIRDNKYYIVSAKC